MRSDDVSRRRFMGVSAGTALGGYGVGTAATGSGSGSGSNAFASGEPGLDSSGSGLGLSTRITFRALVDAVVPETPELADELGEEYVPGGLSVGLAEFMLTYVNNMLSLDVPLLSDGGNLRMATPFAKVLDSAALKLLLLGENESSPRFDRPLDLFEDDEVSVVRIYLQAGTFSKLSRTDRLRTIALLDEFELELPIADDFLFEFDAGLVGQLVVGFTEAVYYSEWDGYDDFWQPPSERVHENDPSAVQGWRQTGFPGLSDGHAALRGYLGAPDSPLGAGETWKELDGGVEIAMESGSFADNEYDTSDYTEPHPPASGATGGNDGGEDQESDADDNTGDDDGDGWWF